MSNIAVSVDVPERHIENAIVSAVESGGYGIHYWGALVFVDSSCADCGGKSYERVPLTMHGALYIFDHNDRHVHRLDYAAIKRGLELCPRDLLFKLVRGEMDAPASERFVQWCLFGREIYG